MPRVWHLIKSLGNSPKSRKSLASAAKSLAGYANRLAPYFSLDNSLGQIVWVFHTPPSILIHSLIDLVYFDSFSFLGRSCYRVKIF